MPGTFRVYRTTSPFSWATDATPSKRGEGPVGEGVDPVEAHRPLVEVPVDELPHGARLEDPAVVHDREPVAQDLGLLHVVGREEDRPSLLA